MILQTINYSQYEKKLPQNGRHIVGQLRGENIIVYQAFNLNISKWAVEHQKFGGPFYKLNRMSWIKPNFLWMMHRAGWAMREHQQKILAIEITKANFERLLKEAVHSSFIEDIYKTKEHWKNLMNQSLVRLQWDPDHDLNGDKLERRAIQIGIKGDLLKKFAEEWIISIEDITPFAHAQKTIINSGNLENLSVAEEQKIIINNKSIIDKLQLD